MGEKGTVEKTVRRLLPLKIEFYVTEKKPCNVYTKDKLFLLLFLFIYIWFINRLLWFMVRINLLNYSWYKYTNVCFSKSRRFYLAVYTRTRYEHLSFWNIDKRHRRRYRIGIFSPHLATILLFCLIWINSALKLCAVKWAEKRLQ